MGNLFKVPAKWNEDIIGWAYVGVLVACSVVTIVTGEAAWLPLVVVAIMGAVEEKQMKRQGVEWPSNWLVLLFPWYLWKRLKALKLPLHILWIWIAVAVALTAAEIVLDGANLEKAAMAQIESGLRERGQTEVDCVKVTLGKEFAPDNYRGKAVFSDGSEINILVQKKNGEVIVRY